MAVALNKRANSFTNNPLFRGMGKIINDVSKETSKIGKNIVNSTKQVVNNVVQGTKNVVNNVKNEAVKIGKNVGKETSRITGNIVNSTKQITKDAVRATVRATNNVRSQASKVVNNIAEKTKKTVRNVASGAKQVVNNVVQGTKNVVNNVKNEAVKIAKNVGKETSRIAGNIVNSTKQVVNNVVQGTKNVVNNVKNEAVKIAKNVGKETSRIAGNIVNSTKQVVNNVVQGTKNVVNNVKNEAKKIITKSVDDIKKEAEKVVKDVADGMGNTVNSLLQGADKLRQHLNGNTKDKKELKKLLEQQENKSFDKLTSKMELGDGTISNRVEMAQIGIYDNFVKNGKNMKDEDIINKTFTVGTGKKKEEFKVLAIKNTRSGMRAFVLGNEKTKNVEIFYEGSNPGLTSPSKDFKNWKKDWANNTLPYADFLLNSNVAGTVLKGLTSKYYKSSEPETPKTYEDALKIAKEVQNEYKNGKNGYKNLTMVSGHSKGGGETIYVASHLDLQAIAVDPAPVENPERYVSNDKILAVVPGNGRGELNDVRQNSAGAWTLKSKATMVGIGDETTKIPVIRVNSFKDEKGKEDKHKADISSVRKIEDDILKLRRDRGIDKNISNEKIR